MFFLHPCSCLTSFLQCSPGQQELISKRHCCCFLNHKYNEHQEAIYTEVDVLIRWMPYHMLQGIQILSTSNQYLSFWSVKLCCCLLTSCTLPMQKAIDCGCPRIQVSDSQEFERAICGATTHLFYAKRQLDFYVSVTAWHTRDAARLRVVFHPDSSWFHWSLKLLSHISWENKSLGSHLHCILVYTCHSHVTCFLLQFRWMGGS